MDVPSTRCEAFTQQGKQCTRRGKSIDWSGKNVCKQHFFGHHAVISVRDPEPWEARGMAAPSDKLRTHVLQKLRRKLKNGPRPSTPRSGNRGGSIYVYCLEDDEHEHLYKVGMTSDSVDKRLQAWARKHKGTTLKRVAEYYVGQDVAWVERVIHLYLDYCRVYRYPRVRGGLESVWAATGKPLNPDTPPVSPRSLLVTEKMIEWFALPFEEIDAVIQGIH